MLIKSTYDFVGRQVATLSAPRVPTNLPVHTFNTRRSGYVAYDLVGYLVLRSVPTGTTGTNMTVPVEAALTRGLAR